jgi:hypothetical protein
VGHLEARAVPGSPASGDTVGVVIPGGGNPQVTLSLRQRVGDPGSPAGTRVLEQNYQFDLVSQAKLIERYIGQPITVEQRHDAQPEWMPVPLIGYIDATVTVRHDEYMDGEYAYRAAILERKTTGRNQIAPDWLFQGVSPIRAIQYRSLSTAASRPAAPPSYRPPLSSMLWEPTACISTLTVIR